MKTDNEIMTALAHESKSVRKMTEEEAQHFKCLLLGMYRDIAALCHNHGLTPMLVGGSALGAVRHQGFIPWDDDLDIALLRTGYERLIALLEAGELGPRYEFVYPRRGQDAYALFLKIYLKDTLNTELCTDTMPFPKGFFIDVFPIDIAPAPGLWRRLKALVADVVQMGSVCVLYAQYPSVRMEQFVCGDKAAQRRYHLRKALGRIGMLLGNHARWAYVFDRFVCATKPTGYLGIASGRKHYAGEIFPADVFFPTSKACFEGVEVEVPGQVGTYLRNLYDDYMQLPPVEKRECHYIVELKFPEE